MFLHLSVVQLARDRLKAILFLSAYFFEDPKYLNSTGNTSFPEILIDLSKYQNEKLVLGSMHLLNRFYSAEVTLFEKAIQTQLLVTDESRRVFAEIEKLLPPLRHHLSVDAGSRREWRSFIPSIDSQRCAHCRRMRNSPTNKTRTFSTTMVSYSALHTF